MSRLACILAALATALPSLSLAQRPVAIRIQAGPGTPVMESVLDELKVLGYHASIEVDPAPSTDPPIGSTPLLRATPGERARVELWMPSAQGMARVEVFEEPDTDAGRRLIGRRVAETLRAYGLLPAPSSAPAASSEPPPQASSATTMSPPPSPPSFVIRREQAEPRQSGATDRPARSSYWLGAGLAGVLSRPSSEGNLGVVLEPTVGSRNWRAGLRAILPVTSGTLNAGEGSATVRTWAGGASGMLAWSGTTFGAMAGLDLSAVLVTSSGTGSQGNTGRDVHAWAALAGGRAGLAYLAHPNLAIRLDVELGSLFPSLRVAFAGEEITRWGAPLLIGALTLEWRAGAEGF